MCLEGVSSDLRAFGFEGIRMLMLFFLRRSFPFFIDVTFMGILLGFQAEPLLHLALLWHRILAERCQAYPGWGQSNCIYGLFVVFLSFKRCLFFSFQCRSFQFQVLRPSTVALWLCIDLTRVTATSSFLSQGTGKVPREQ